MKKENMHENRIALQYDKDIAELIKIIRTTKEITMEELAKKIGISYQQYQKYESGLNRISIGRFMQIAEVLDIKLTGLFDFPTLK